MCRLHQIWHSYERMAVRCPFIFRKRQQGESTEVERVDVQRAGQLRCLQAGKGRRSAERALSGGGGLADSIPTPDVQLVVPAMPARHHPKTKKQCEYMSVGIRGREGIVRKKDLDDERT